MRERHPLVAKVISVVRPRYTMAPDSAIDAVVSLTIGVIESKIPGDLVECGTWMGGCSFAMLLAQRYAYGEIRRPVWMYDSFQGMSPPADEDGEAARGWYAISETLPKDKASNDYCIAPLEMVQQNIKDLGLTDSVVLRPGWFKDTLLQSKPETIALLRIDCDWYDPVKLVWEELEPRLSPGGPVIIDDYYAWQGASLATHEYMGKHKMPWPLMPIDGLNGAWTIRGDR